MHHSASGPISAHKRDFLPILTVAIAVRKIPRRKGTISVTSTNGKESVVPSIIATYQMLSDGTGGHGIQKESRLGTASAAQSGLLRMGKQQKTDSSGNLHFVHFPFDIERNASLRKAFLKDFSLYRGLACCYFANGVWHSKHVVTVSVRWPPLQQQQQQ